jgi:monoamine oxidase
MMSTRRRDVLKVGAAAVVVSGIAPRVQSAAPASIPDVAIIGGGFAGITAARELSMRGRSAVLLEARDRLGGRTHTAEHDGHGLELGGTWVHPAQPNVWAELTRYGLAVEAMPEPGGRQTILSAGKLIDLDDAGMMRALEALGQFCAPAAELYPAPYSDRWGPDPNHYGDRTVREYLASLQLSPLLHDALDAMLSTLASSPLDKPAASEMMRVYALAGYSPMQMFAALSGTKIAGGTRSLIDAIARQAHGVDVRLVTPVRRVLQTSGSVTVELAGGGAVVARTALVTLPMNVLNSVTFEPQLSTIKRAASAERHAGAGVKCYVHVKGDVGNVSVFAPEREAINWAATYKHGPNGSLLIVFGNSPERLPLGDMPRMQAALERLLPDVKVERTFGWDWDADPYALGTWCVFRPGQPNRVLPGLRTPEGRLFFASGDSAVAWRGFIDGAIESGYRSAREIDRYLLARPD